ncbi:MAG TPA: energy-coupling factor transporter transmembrane component T, partial [Anaerolineales bacterium]
ALPVRDLISLIPRAFFPVAVVTSIAVTYLPTTMRQFQQIREAQAIRGHQVRTLRDWLPLWMPLLVGGLEHAMQLAEAMTARGFASSTPLKQRVDIYPRMCMVLGLGLLVTGWLAQLGSAGTWGLLLIISGALLIIGGLWYLGRQSPRTAYHRPRWSWQDCLTLIIATGVIALCVLPVPGLDRQTLNYEPYPSLRLPPFSPWLGIAMLGLIVPGFLVLLRNPKRGRSYESKKEGI